MFRVISAYQEAGGITNIREVGMKRRDEQIIEVTRNLYITIAD